jgi:DNA polymerase IIIc chi subunit
LERLLDESFLAHGRARDGDSALQPVYLTVGLENPNGAALRLFLTYWQQGANGRWEMKS